MSSVGQESKCQVAVLCGQDLENRLAHPHHELSGVPPGTNIRFKLWEYQKTTFSAISVLYDKITVSWLLGIFTHL